MNDAAANSARPAAIYESLRAGILDGSEAPGSTLTESRVALRFGVTRPTAKLAIERLAAEGLLRRAANQAARVPELTRDDIVDLYDTRAIVETAAVEALARGGDLPAGALAAHRSLLAHTTDESFAHDDIAFHRALVSGAPSARLPRMHALLMGEIELCMGQVQAHHLITTGEVAAQHQGILDAVTAGDAARAGALTRDHITGSRDRLLAHYDATHRER